MIHGFVFGGDALIQRLRAIGPKLGRALLVVVRKQAFKLQAHVKRDKLSGQVLHVRTGTLRRSVTAKVEQTGGRILGIVGTNLAYAGRHEFGFDGTETVREHLRRVTQAWGKPLRTPREVRVHAFMRHARAPERSFLRSALRDMAGEIREALKAAVVGVLRETKA